MRKIAVSLTKGGVGKTTTAVNLAAGLAFNGANVLLLDTDIQGQAGFMLGVRADAGLADVLSGNCRIQDVLIEARENLWLMDSGKTLAGVKRMVENEADGGEKAVCRAMASVEGKYDYVILDTSPGWDVMTINVLFYANEILTPVSMEMLSVQGLVEFNRRLEPMRHHNSTAINYVVPTFLDGRVKKSDEIMHQLQAHFSPQICAPIRYNVRLSEAPGYGQTIHEFAPRSKGAEDYRSLTQRIIQDGNAQEKKDG